MSDAGNGVIQHRASICLHLPPLGAPCVFGKRGTANAPSPFEFDPCASPGTPERRHSGAWTRLPRSWGREDTMKPRLSDCSDPDPQKLDSFAPHRDENQGWSRRAFLTGTAM